MGKATNGLGQFRGKVGSVVFRVNQGEQIVSAYQPQVRNPKSNLQTAQRNKFYLASQLNKLVSDYDIAGLGTTPRNRRSEFIKNIVVNAVSNLNNGVFTTSIKEDKVLFSKGTDSGIEHLLVVAAVNEGRAQFSINFTDLDSNEVANLALKTIEVHIRNNEYVYLKSSYLQLPDSGTVQTYDVEIPDDTKVILYAVPFRLKDSYRVVEQKLTQLQFNSATNENEYVVIGEYGESAASYLHHKSFVIGSWGSAGVVATPNFEDNVVNPSREVLNTTNDTHRVSETETNENPVK